MAVAVNRQFEVLWSACRGSFPTKISLARSIVSRAENLIDRGLPSTFQVTEGDDVIPMQPKSIVPYISVAQTIGLLDSSLGPVSPLGKATRLKGFINHLKEVIPAFTKKHGFSLNEIRDFIRHEISSGTFPRAPITPRLLHTSLNPDLSEFDFNQCLALMDELYNDTFRVRSIRCLLHRQALWGPG